LLIEVAGVVLAVVQGSAAAQETDYEMAEEWAVLVDMEPSSSPFAA
jgi:hypothetical protein